MGYMQNRVSQQFVPSGAPPFKPEHGVEFNALLDPLPMLLECPAVRFGACMRKKWLDLGFLSRYRIAVVMCALVTKTLALRLLLADLR